MSKELNPSKQNQGQTSNWRLMPKDIVNQMLMDMLINPSWEVFFSAINKESMEFLGSGSEGFVYKVKYKKQVVAMKELRKGDVPLKKENFILEIAIHLRLERHPNVVNFIGACRKPVLCLLTQFLDGDPLFNIHEQNKLVDIAGHKIDIAYQICKGMRNLHICSIVHNDLWSMNIILCKAENGGFIPKIVDMGISRIIGTEDPMIGKKVWTDKKSPAIVSTKRDIYSFGILLWEIFTELNPELNVNKKNARPMLKTLATEEFASLVELIQDCWNPDFAKRLNSFNQVMERIKKLPEQIKKL